MKSQTKSDRMAITVLLTWHCGQLGLVDAMLSAGAGYLSLWVPHLLFLPQDKRGGRLFFLHFNPISDFRAEIPRLERTVYFLLMIPPQSVTVQLQ